MIANMVSWLALLGGVFFIIVGQIYMENAASPETRSSMQALIFAATMGLGLFLGTQAAGMIMDRFSVDGKFQWQKVWLVPLAVVLVCTLVLLVMFRNPAG